MLKFHHGISIHTASSPNIDSAFLLNRTPPKHRKLPSEQQQIESIRALGKYLLEEQADSTVTFEEKQGQSLTAREPKLSIYERGQLTQRRKLERIVEAQKAESRKILGLSSRTIGKATSRKSAQISEKSNKQAFMTKGLLEKCLQEEAEARKMAERQLGNCKTSACLKKQSRKAGRKELQMIFEEVQRRGEELLQRRESTVQHYLQLRYEQEMKGVTFHPQLKSTKSLRNCSKGFLERLQADHRHRERQKVHILAEELRRDSYEPKLNSQRNSLSKSKVHSFRLQDSAFLVHSKPELALQKQLSRFVYPEEDSLVESRTNQSMQIALKASELTFLFE